MCSRLRKLIFPAGLLLEVIFGGFFNNLGAATKIITPSDNLMGAVSALVPGDVLILRGGSYGPIINTTIRGTASARIVIKSAPGERAVLKSIGVSGGRYLDFEDITSDMQKTPAGSDEALWLGNGASYNRFFRCEFRNAKGQGVLIPHQDCVSNEFWSCRAHHNGTLSLNGVPQDHGWYISGKYNLLDGCEADYNFGYGVQIYNGYSSERADGNIIRKTRAHHNGTGGSAAGLAVAGGSNNQLVENDTYSNPRDIDVAWKNPVGTIIRKNKAGTIFINTDAQNTAVDYNCIDPAKINNKGQNTTGLGTNSPTACGGSIPTTPPPPTDVDVTQTQPPPSGQQSSPPSFGIIAAAVGGIILLAALGKD